MVAPAMVMAVAFRVPGHPLGARWADQALELVKSPLPGDLRVNIAQSLHIFYIYMGDHGSARFLIQLLEQVLDEGDLSVLIKIQWHLMQAVHYHMVRARIEKCEQVAKIGLKLGNDSGAWALSMIFLTIWAYGRIMTRTWPAWSESSPKYSLCSVGSAILISPITIVCWPTGIC